MLLALWLAASLVDVSGCKPVKSSTRELSRCGDVELEIKVRYGFDAKIARDMWKRDVTGIASMSDDFKAALAEHEGKDVATITSKADAKYAAYRFYAAERTGAISVEVICGVENVANVDAAARKCDPWMKKAFAQKPRLPDDPAKRIVAIYALDEARKHEAPPACAGDQETGECATLQLTWTGGSTKNYERQIADAESSLRAGDTAYSKTQTQRMPCYALANEAECSLVIRGATAVVVAHDSERVWTCANALGKCGDLFRRRDGDATQAIAAPPSAPAAPASSAAGITESQSGAPMTSTSGAAALIDAATRSQGMTAVRLWDRAYEADPAMARAGYAKTALDVAEQSTSLTPGEARGLVKVAQHVAPGDAEVNARAAALDAKLSDNTFNVALGVACIAVGVGLEATGIAIAAFATDKLQDQIVGVGVFTLMAVGPVVGGILALTSSSDALKPTLPPDLSDRRAWLEGAE